MSSNPYDVSRAFVTGDTCTCRADKPVAVPSRDFPEMSMDWVVDRIPDGLCPVHAERDAEIREGRNL